MRSLQLLKGEELQGKFSPRRLNLLLIFQVNCPGCFQYALPVFSQLHKQFQAQFGFLALSTAFEDFELNTEANTRLLLEQGELVGETKKALGSVSQLPFSMDFPVAMDEQINASGQARLIDRIWKSYGDNVKRDPAQKAQLEKWFELYFRAYPSLSLTFTANQFRGTPTHVIFNDRMEILRTWFGYLPNEKIVEELEKVAHLESRQQGG